MLHAALEDAGGRVERARQRPRGRGRPDRLLLSDLSGVFVLLVLLLLLDLRGVRGVDNVLEVVQERRAGRRRAYGRSVAFGGSPAGISGVKRPG